MYKIVVTKDFKKDVKKIRQYPALYGNLKKIVEGLRENPYAPPREKLIMPVPMFSKRINIQHRLVYTVSEEKQEVKLLSCWGHYVNL